MAKTFDQYMAESGQQSALDSIRATPGGYEKAVAQYNTTGNYGNTSSPSKTTASPIPNTTASPSPRLAAANTVASNIKAVDTQKSAQVNTARNDLANYYNNLNTPMEYYNKFSTEQGITDQQNLVNMLTKQTMQYEDKLGAVEGNVNERMKTGGGFVTEGSRQSIVNREQQPIAEELTKLLRSKQYEEIGLQGKQQLVQQLVSLSMQGDEMKAKPLQLNVDYTQADRDIALKLIADIGGMQMNALSADIGDANTKQAAADTRAYDTAQTANSQNFQKEMAKYTNDLNLQSSEAMAKLNASLKDNASKSTNPVEVATDNAWNMLLGNSQSEYEVWKQMTDDPGSLMKMGADMDELWKRFYALKAEVGTDGAIRKQETDPYAYF